MLIALTYWGGFGVLLASGGADSYGRSYTTLDAGSDGWLTRADWTMWL